MPSAAWLADVPRRVAAGEADPVDALAQARQVTTSAALMGSVTVATLYGSQALRGYTQAPEAPDRAR